MKIRQQVPAFYGSLLSAKILDFNPVERIATCEQCYRSQECRTPKSLYYKPDLKCCTFYPFLPNYMVGAIFSDSDPGLEGARKTLRDLIAKRRYSLPVGMVAPIPYQVEFLRHKERDFGKNEKWLCPYYDKEHNNCSVWRYRGVVCTTFYCKSSYGKKGSRYWQKLSDYLSYVEMGLLEEALAHLDFSPRNVVDLLDYLNRTSATSTSREKKAWVIPEKKARLLWNGYFSDQEEFFKKCYSIVSKMSRVGFNELLGPPGVDLRQEIFKASALIDGKEV